MTAGEEKTWWVYVLTSRKLPCRTYVGSTVDPQRRLRQHNGEESGGAANTRAGRPWRIGRLHGPYPDRSAAQRIEAEIKRRSGRERVRWEPGSA